MNKEILHRAIDILSRREHGYNELLQKLQMKDFFNEDIEPVMEYLVEKNYQSDERFADNVFRNRVDRGYGWLFIENELIQKGVSHHIIDQVLKNNEIDWYLQAELAYNKRFAISEISGQKDKEKRVRFLQYRGFSLDEIMALLKC